VFVKAAPVRLAVFELSWTQPAFIQLLAMLKFPVADTTVPAFVKLVRMFPGPVKVAPKALLMVPAPSNELSTSAPFTATVPALVSMPAGQSHLLR
jgi:hypothetical protein